MTLSCRPSGSHNAVREGGKGDLESDVRLYRFPSSKEEDEKSDVCAKMCNLVIIFPLTICKKKKVFSYPDRLKEFAVFLIQ